ncbi:hypothetical protein YC2023_094131 [Brassica napus]
MSDNIGLQNAHTPVMLPKKSSQKTRLSPDGAGEFSGGFDGADEFSDEAEKLYKLRRTRRSLTFSSIEK